MIISCQIVDISSEDENVEYELDEKLLLERYPELYPKGFKEE
jgi:hypothetical protein